MRATHTTQPPTTTITNKHKQKPQNKTDVFFFDFGVICCWGLSQLQEQAIVSGAARRAAEEPLPAADVEIDAFEFVYSAHEPPKMQNDTITVNRRQAADHQVVEGWCWWWSLLLNDDDGVGGGGDDDERGGGDNDDAPHHTHAAHPHLSLTQPTTHNTNNQTNQQQQYKTKQNKHKNPNKNTNKPQRSSSRSATRSRNRRSSACTRTA